MWLVLELVVIYLTLTVMSIHSHLNKWDIVSFSTYKYVGMICVLLAGLLSASKLVYYAALAYVSAALAFFLLRTLKLRIEPEVSYFSPQSCQSQRLQWQRHKPEPPNEAPTNPSQKPSNPQGLSFKALGCVGVDVDTSYNVA